MGPDPVLTIRDVRKAFGQPAAPVRALQGFDLTIEEGELVALVGPSGCGKSTLLHLVAGLDTADGGEIILAGHALGGLDDDARARLRRRHVGFVFQFFNLLEGMTALENVIMPALIARQTRRAAEARARSLLDLLGLAERAATRPSLLSGGQRQRLAIARALANEPTLLLADEPTGALDTVGGAEVLELFRRLNERGQTILVVTHDDAVASVANRVVGMRDGRVDAAVGAPG